MRLGLLVLMSVALLSSCSGSVSSAKPDAPVPLSDDVYVDDSPECQAVAIVGPGAQRWDQLGSTKTPEPSTEPRTMVPMTTPDYPRGLDVDRSWTFSSFTYVSWDSPGGLGWLVVSIPPSEWNALTASLTSTEPAKPARWTEVFPSEFKKHEIDCPGLWTVVHNLDETQDFVVVIPSYRVDEL